MLLAAVLQDMMHDKQSSSNQSGGHYDPYLTPHVDPYLTPHVDSYSSPHVDPYSAPHVVHHSSPNVVHHSPPVVHHSPSVVHHSPHIDPYAAHHVDPYVHGHHSDPHVTHSDLSPHVDPHLRSYTPLPTYNHPALPHAHGAVSYQPRQISPTYYYDLLARWGFGRNYWDWWPYNPTAFQNLDTRCYEYALKSCASSGNRTNECLENTYKNCLAYMTPLH